MTWLAHIVQQPTLKPGSTLVITGRKGTGKSTLFDYMNQLLGRHGITVSQRKQIVGQFNGHLATTLLMVCEEAFWAADPQAEGVMKDMITNKSMLIEKKGYDPIQSLNYTRLALISNMDWVVPASLKDERRFGVFRCGPMPAVATSSSSTPCAARWSSEGGLEAMLLRPAQLEAAGRLVGRASTRRLSPLLCSNSRSSR
jgi:energy-coupling factor transporter ATP-binding protein EcfA2